jgi:ADP-ribose pyrophosphatase YjhB (NUDIX family)
MEKEEILEFGIKRDNEERRDGGCCVVFHPEIKKYAVYKRPNSKVFGLFGGGFNEGEDERIGSIRELIEESGLTDHLSVERVDKVITHYYNNNKNIARIAHAVCFLVVLKSDKRENMAREEHENSFQFVWATEAEIVNSWKENNHNEDYSHWIYFMEKASKRIKELGFIY